MHRRQSRSQRQRVKPNPVSIYQRLGHDIKCIDTALERLDGGRDILRLSDFSCNDLEAECAGRSLNLTHFEYADRIADIGQDCQPAESVDNLAQEFESLAGNIAQLV